MINSQQINNAIVYYQDYLFRWIDAIGKNVVKAILGPSSPCDDTTGDPVDAVVTVTEAGGGGDSTLVNAQSAGYNLLFTTDNADYDGINYQRKGEAFKLEAGKPLAFRAKIKASEATQSDLLVGLCELKTDLLKTGTAHGITASNVEGVFFFKADGATTIQAQSYKDGSSVASANASAAMSTSDTYYEIYWDGTTVYFYLDGVLVTSTTSIPDGDLTVSINFRTGSAAAITAYVADLSCIQVR